MKKAILSGTILALLPFLMGAKQWQVGQRSFGAPAAACTPVLAYAMNEGSGSTFFDSSGFGNNATISSGAVIWQTNSPLPGTTPFFTSLGYALAANDTHTNFDGTTPFTVSARMFTTQTAPADAINTLNATGGSYQGWDLNAFYFSGTRYLIFLLISTNTSNEIFVQQNTASSSLSSGLHYLTATYDGSRHASGVGLYVDGSVIATTISTDNLTASTASGLPPRLGAWNDGTNPLNNAMTSVEVWPCVLSPTKIAACAAGSNLC